MLKNCSDLTEEQVAHCLARIRQIASLGDEAALDEVDKLFYEFITDYDEGYAAGSEAEDESAGYSGADIYYGLAAEMIEEFRQKVESKCVTFTDLDYFRTGSADGSYRWPEAVGEIEDRCLSLREERDALLRAVPCLALRQLLDKAATYRLCNIVSVRDIMG